MYIYTRTQTNTYIQVNSQPEKQAPPSRHIIGDQYMYIHIYVYTHTNTYIQENSQPEKQAPPSRHIIGDPRPPQTAHFLASELTTWLKQNIKKNLVSARTDWHG